MKLSRREALVAVGAGAAMVPWPALARGPVRVCVALEGGLDALSLCAPVGEERYRELRAGTALERAIPFSPGVFLNRALAPLVPLIHAGRVGLLRGVGLREVSRAHLAARSIVLAELGAVFASALIRPRCAAATFCRLAGEGGLSAQLQTASRMIAAGFSGGILVSVPGFDTHSAQRTRLQDLLTELAHGLGAFHDRLGEDGSRTRLFTLTEFGRSPAENSTGGTEDGGASAMLMLGGGTPGGLLGAAPTLDDAWAIPVTADVREWTARLVAA